MTPKVSSTGSRNNAFAVATGNPCACFGVGKRGAAGDHERDHAQGTDDRDQRRVGEFPEEDA